MNCTFFGHRNAPSSVKAKLKAEILNLIKLGVNCFYVGNNGNFDMIVQETLFELLQSNRNIKVYIVLSRIDEKAISGYQELSVFPEELAKDFKRFAINKRNEYMIKKSTHVISYVNDTATCSARWVNLARKANKQILNLYAQK